jgi:dephospho-CoA kinase
MFVIGLTGGIGSGKSAAAELFSVLGVPIVDADRIAHQIVQKGSNTLHNIVKQFGSKFLLEDGTLDRLKVRNEVFSNEQKRKRLEAIMHPAIRAEILRQLNQTEGPYAILVIPLLLETNQTDLVDRILVIDVPEYVQIQRVVARDGVSESDVSKILKAQISSKQRRAAADDIIDNSIDRARLGVEVKALHQRYLQYAKDNP